MPKHLVDLAATPNALKLVFEHAASEHGFSHIGVFDLRFLLQPTCFHHRTAVAGLPEELRLPLILSEYEDKSHAQIGEILSCSAKAVETRIYRPRQRLRQSLATLINENT